MHISIDHINDLAKLNMAIKRDQLHLIFPIYEAHFDKNGMFNGKTDNATLLH